jgi:hypothetical protein
VIDPYARPTGRIARVVDGARYGVAMVILGGASVVGVGGLCAAALGALAATLISGRAVRDLIV